MQITGGIARGIRIDAPPGARTRPTTDRIRESLFGMLQGFVSEARVIDLYAGSGSLGLEAASRGAAEVTFVEQHAATAALVKRNWSRLPPAGVAGRATVVCAEVGRWLKGGGGVPADLILADPPYDALPDAAALAALLQAIRSAGLLQADGLLSLEISGRLHPEIPAGWHLLRRKDYGSSAVLLLEPEGAGEG